MTDSSEGTPPTQERSLSTENMTLEPRGSQELAGVTQSRTGKVIRDRDSREGTHTASGRVRGPGEAGRWGTPQGLEDGQLEGSWTGRGRDGPAHHSVPAASTQLAARVYLPNRVGRQTDRQTHTHTHTPRSHPLERSRALDSHNIFFLPSFLPSIESS